MHHTSMFHALVCLISLFHFIFCVYRFGVNLLCVSANEEFARSQLLVSSLQFLGVRFLVVMGVFLGFCRVSSQVKS